MHFENHSIKSFNYKFLSLKLSYPNNSSLDLQVANYKCLIMQFNDVKIILFFNNFLRTSTSQVTSKSSKVHLIFVHCCCFITFLCIVLSLVSYIISIFLLMLKTLFSNCLQKTYYSLFDCLFKQTQICCHQLNQDTKLLRS